MLKRRFKFQNRGDSQGISGYAFRFSETINFMGQLERFSPELGIDLNSAGTFLFRDHNPERVLARVPKNLRIKTDSEGLAFESDYIDTPLWKETRELISQGVLNGCSVGFSVIKERKEKDILVYERIKLYEISLVTWPAYSSSEVSARSEKEKEPLPPELLL